MKVTDLLDGVKKAILKGFKIATDAATVESEFRYDSTAKKIKFHNGTAERTVLDDDNISTNSDFTQDTTKIPNRATVKTLFDSAATKNYYQNAVTLSSGNNTITHNLGLTNKDAFHCTIKDSTGKQILPNEVSGSSVNVIIINLTAAETNCKIFITGL